MTLVYASPVGEHRHRDKNCAANDSGAWPVLRMSDRAASAKDLGECPMCMSQQSERPGFGLGMAVSDFKTGEKICARVSAQWFAGFVERRYVEPEDGVAARAVCGSDQGYEFHVEKTDSGRTRVVKMSGGRITANVLELLRSKR